MGTNANRENYVRINVIVNEKRSKWAEEKTNKAEGIMFFIEGDGMVGREVKKLWIQKQKGVMSDEKNDLSGGYSLPHNLPYQWGSVCC